MADAHPELKFVGYPRGPLIAPPGTPEQLERLCNAYFRMWATICLHIIGTVWVGYVVSTPYLPMHWLAIVGYSCLMAAAAYGTATQIAAGFKWRRAWALIPMVLVGLNVPVWAMISSQRWWGYVCSLACVVGATIACVVVFKSIFARYGVRLTGLRFKAQQREFHRGTDRLRYEAEHGASPPVPANLYTGEGP